MAPAYKPVIMTTIAINVLVVVLCTGGPGLDNLRRFEIAEVRRKSRNLPRGYLQADFDIVHPSGLPPADKLLAEAEVIKVCAVLCCAVLCCAVLCCAALRCAALCCAALCGVVKPS